MPTKTKIEKPEPKRYVIREASEKPSFNQAKPCGDEGDGYSPAYLLLQFVWDQIYGLPEFSYRKLNSGMQSTLVLAIETELRFEPEDFAHIFSDFRGDYWFGVNGGGDSRTHGENFYSRACRTGNKSACISFEKWKERKPFILIGERVFIGHQFVIDRVRYHVTSFKGDGSAFVACAYKDKETGKPYDRVISERRTFTRDDVKAMNDAAKPAKTEPGTNGEAQ